MKSALYIMFLATLMLLGCTRNTMIKVEYQASEITYPYTIKYLNGDGRLIQQTINPVSQEDIWTYSLLLNEGSIVYLSGIYKNSNASLRLTIKVDGKIYKEGYSQNDTLNYLVVSGVVPYSN